MSSRPTRARGALALVVLATMLAVAGCTDVAKPAAASGGRAPSASPGAVGTAVSHRPPGTRPGHRRVTPARRPNTTPPRQGTALAQLGTLEVAGRAPMTGYDRDRFGQAWLDADRNGCDTRNDVLRRDLRPFSVEPGTHGCVVLRGVLADPYTGSGIDFVRAATYSVDIDHVVALGNAWVSGAWRFGIRERAALANDPLNLLAVDAGANRQKGDANAASWLPANTSYRCAYVARQVAVKAKYHLRVTASERAAIARVLRSCPGQPATADPTHAPTRVDQNITDPGAQGSTSRSSTPAASGGGRGSGSGGPVYYQNCDAARAAGAAPLHRGDPGYDSHLDRDGDGTACE